MRDFYCFSCDHDFQHSAPTSCPRCGATDAWIEEIEPGTAPAIRAEGQAIAEQVADEDFARGRR